MKTRTFLTSLLVVAGMACTTAFAQGGGGGGGGGGGFGGGGRGFGGGLTPENSQALRDSMTASQADVTALTEKLTAAQKEAVTAATTAGATEAAIKAKIEAVAKIQTDIAMLRFNKGIKSLKISAEEKTAMEATPGLAYQSLFGGLGGGRGMGGGGGGGGARRGGGGGGVN